MKPLQTHGRYVETWVPPKERFVRYEKSDERWARPLGIGTVRSDLENLYDVRDYRFELVGYTYHNPASSGPRQRMVMSCIDPDISFCRADDYVKPASKMREVIVRTELYGFNNETFVTWRTSLEDAQFLIHAGWICAFGVDNKHEWLHELKARQYRWEDVCYGIGSVAKRPSVPVSLNWGLGG